ncbi:MAG: PAS domain-containing sensor histidine kinase [Bacteroidales bacterium]|nr:PAS domain-containing sensor histidine kinase [Bacteroidales bacterium]
MKIQYKFLIVFVAAFAITIVPNLFLFKSEIIAWLPISWWTYLSIARFILLIGLFVVVTRYWIIKPLNQIALSLSLDDPAPVEILSQRRDEIGKIGLLLQRFFAQRKELDQVMHEKSQALESVAFSEAKSRALLNAIPDLLFRINIFGVITDYHAPDPSELFLKPEKFLGKNMEEIMPEHVVINYQQAIQDLVRLKKSQIFEYSLHMPDGSERAYEAMVSATGVGDYLISVRNITIRKEAELEISRMLSKQQELNQLKSRFISLVSHEFRTPLSAISSNIQLLSRYQEKWPVEKKVEVIRRVQEAIQNMITLLEEVTLISKDQTGALTVNPESLNINDFVQDVIEELRKSSELPVHLELNIDQGEDNIHSDKELLRQILSHLLSNAGKFNPEKQPVRVTIARENNHIEMIVSDQGIGIPERDLEQLFQPFHRCSNSDEFPGTGLGMSIVKRCVDLLKGSIRVISKENVGTTFEVKIPVKTIKTTMYE